MRVCIAGKNDIAVFGLKLLILKLGKENILACPNSDDDGSPSWQPSLARYAERLGIQIVNLEDLYDQDDIIFLSLEFNKIIIPKLMT